MLFRHPNSLGNYTYQQFIHTFIQKLLSFQNRFFNDTELKNSGKHKIEAKQNVYTLTVNKCDHPDVGTYRALVDNGIDHTEQTAKLHVGGIFHF